MTEERTGHSNTLFQQYKRQISHGHQQMVITEIRFIIFFCSQRWRSSIQSAKTRPGADYGSKHELLIAKLRFKLKKVGKTTRPFRYDLNQIPSDYTVEELDLADQVPGELWTEIRNIV